MISVIIPVLNEESTIKGALDHLFAFDDDLEIIVVDGGSRDKTVEVAKELAVVVRSKQGRALQMNTGAGRATGDVLFFQHADCRPEKGAFTEILRLLRDPRVVGGALTYDVDKRSIVYRNHVFWSNLRARTSNIFLGDHGVFVRKGVFDQIGGYPHIPLMEDVALCKMLKTRGRLVQAKSKMLASTRRFDEEGFVRTVLMMWKNRLLYRLGTDPEKLTSGYRNIR